jgi:hypothetical protein
MPDDPFAKLDKFQQFLLDTMTSCEVCLNINQGLVAQGHFSKTKDQLEMCEFGLDVIEWLRKYKRQRLIDGED